MPRRSEYAKTKEFLGSFGTGAFSFPGFPEFSFGAGVDAVEADFVAIERVEAGGTVDDGFEGEDGADDRSFSREFGVARLIADLFGDAGALHSPYALLTPFGYGHGFDEFELGVGLREVLGDDAGEHGVETVVVFAFHDDGLREEAVAFGVAGADALAFGGYGAFRFSAVGLGGADAFF